jgi:hypothetical protein
MDLNDKQMEILTRLAENEEAIANLYGLYAARFTRL